MRGPAHSTQPLISIQNMCSSGESTQLSRSRSHQPFRLQPANFFAKNKKNPHPTTQGPIRVDTDSDSNEGLPHDIYLHSNVRPYQGEPREPQSIIKMLSEKYLDPYEPHKYQDKIPSQQAIRIHSENENIRPLYHGHHINQAHQTKERVIRKHMQSDRRYEQEMLRNVFEHQYLKQENLKEKNRNRSHGVDPNLHLFLEDYPKFVHRLDKNQDEIVFLQHKLNNKIKEDEIKERMRLAQFNKRLAAEDHYNRYYDEKQIWERNQRKRQEEKLQRELQMELYRELQREKAQKLEHLIQKNRDLSAKIVQHRNRKHRFYTNDQYDKFEHQIEQLRLKHQQAVSPYPKNLANLDISVIKHTMGPIPPFKPKIILTDPNHQVRQLYRPQASINQLRPQKPNYPLKKQEDYNIYGKKY